jgi:hypothetical protein
MAKEKVIVTLVGMNDGFSIKNNGIVEQKISAAGDELGKAIQILQMAGTAIKVSALLESGDTIKLGKFNFFSMKVDRDAESKLVLRADTETVDTTVASQLTVNELITFSFVGAKNADDK